MTGISTNRSIVNDLTGGVYQKILRLKNILTYTVKFNVIGYWTIFLKFIHLVTVLKHRQKETKHQHFTMLAIRAYRAHFCRYQIARLYSSVSKAKEASHKYADTICLPKTDFPNRSGSGEQIQKLIQRSSDEIYQWQIKLLLTMD